MSAHNFLAFIFYANFGPLCRKKSHSQKAIEFDRDVFVSVRFLVFALIKHGIK